MKKVFFLLLILLSAHGNMLYADESKNVELEGDLLSNGTRSLSSLISAVSYSDYIKVNFAIPLDEISIRIYDERNDIVYEDMADISIQSSVISTVLFETGTYRIEFTNSQGRHLEGSFVIK
ncbi:MAG: DUF3244 domain-containing protein [Prevotella sp.]|jgi:hypothetical protein|nr:DUF3244 domain-containing protein [Prevotella sp.]